MFNKISTVGPHRRNTNVPSLERGVPAPGRADIAMPDARIVVDRFLLIVAVIVPMPLEKSISASSEPTAPAKVGFVSLGCPKNLIDSEVMMGMLAQAGAELTPNAEDADVIVVNTCSFIGSAQQESIDTILEMARHKTTPGGKAKRLVVAGCLVERFHDEIRKNIPEVDAVVGTGELEKILAAAGVAEAPRAPDGET